MIYKAYKISELLNDTLYENAFLYIHNNNAQHILVLSYADKQTIYSSEYILNLLLEKFPSLVDIINTKAIIRYNSVAYKLNCDFCFKKYNNYKEYYIYNNKEVKNNIIKTNLIMNIDTNNFSYINCIFGSNLEIHTIDRKVSSTKNLRGCYTIFLKPIE